MNTMLYNKGSDTLN